jgi:hypothetical protein
VGIVHVEAQPHAHSCRRRSPREEVVLAGSAFGVGRSRSVIVSDLSTGGAQLNARDLPPENHDIFVVVGPFESLGTVVWRTSDKCGIAFELAVTDEAIGRMKREAQWESVSGWYR